MIEHIENLSKSFREPEWLLNWRKKYATLGAALPAVEKYGIGISGVDVSTDAPSVPPAYRVGSISKELELYTWREALQQEHIQVILQGLLESPLLPEPTHRMGAYARAQFADALVLYAMPAVGQDGTVREEFFALETAARGTAADIVVIIVKQGAKLKFFNQVRSTGDAVSMREIIFLLENDAHVEVVDSGEDNIQAKYAIFHTALIAAHSSVAFTETPWSAHAYKSETRSILLGEKASTAITHAIVADGEGVYDMWSGVTHTANNTQSRITARGVGLGKSKTVYRGLIDMKPGVTGVDGAQDGRFLALAPTAEIDAIPSLDIASKDVSCVHKLSVTHIRDVDMFYPKLRGFSEEEGKEVVIEGHFSGLADVEQEELMRRVQKSLTPVAPPASTPSVAQ